MAAGLTGQLWAGGHAVPMLRFLTLDSVPTCLQWKAVPCPETLQVPQEVGPLSDRVTHLCGTKGHSSAESGLVPLGPVEAWMGWGTAGVARAPAGKAEERLY